MSYYKISEYVCMKKSEGMRIAILIKWAAENHPTADISIVHQESLPLSYSLEWFPFIPSRETRARLGATVINWHKNSNHWSWMTKWSGRRWKGRTFKSRRKDKAKVHELLQVSSRSLIFLIVLHEFGLLWMYAHLVNFFRYRWDTEGKIDLEMDEKSPKNSIRK